MIVAGASLADMARSMGKTRTAIQKKRSRMVDVGRLSKDHKTVYPHTEPPPDDETEISLVREEHGNILEITSKSARIKTLPQLIEAAEIDLEIWAIERHIINKWEVAGKFGSAPDQYFEVQDLWQVKAWLVKKRPLALEPVVSPVVISVKLPKRTKKKESPHYCQGLLLPDPQFGFKKSLRTAKLDPFHDRAALDIALQIAQDYELDFLAWLGDFMDLADWTDKYTRSPNFYWTTQPAAIEGKWWLTQFRMADPHPTEMFLIEGNHETRMRTQIMNHFKEAYGIRSVDALDLPPLMSIPRLLALHDLDIEWVGDWPNGEVWLNDYIACEHGPLARGKSGATVSAYVQEVNETRIIAHIHRIESASRTVHERTSQRTVSVISVGCLCRVDGAVPGKRAKVNWQQGIGFVEYYTDGRSDHVVTAIPINNGQALFRGKLYVARDRVEELRADVLGMYPSDEAIGWNF